MFSFRTTPLDSQEDLVLRRGRLAVLCNQSAWNPGTGEYLFEQLYKKGRLVKVFFPADGIFGELRQEACGTDASYADLGLDGCAFIPLRQNQESCFQPGMLEDIDALIVEYQDTGSRYDTVTSVLYELFQLIHGSGLQLSVYVLDRENMCGRWVEGTALGSDGDRTAGIEEGRAAEAKETAKRLYAMNVSIETIAKGAKASIEDVQEWIGCNSDEKLINK